MYRNRNVSPWFLSLLQSLKAAVAAAALAAVVPLPGATPVLYHLPPLDLAINAGVQVASDLLGKVSQLRKWRPDGLCTFN